MKLLKKYSPALFVLLALLLLVTGVFSLLSLPAVSKAASSMNRVSDNAELFTTGEVTSLESQSRKLEEKYDISVRILTEPNLGGKSVTVFIEDYFDSELEAGRLKSDAAILFISMEPGNRTVEIQGYGKCKTLLSSERIDKILDQITPLLADGDYGEAAGSFLDKTGYYMSHKKDGIFYKTWFQLVIALVIGGISVAVLIPYDRGRVTTNSHTYLDESHSGVTARRDIYLRTIVTKRKRPEQNSGSGSGGGSRNTGGTSSGGASHSGGSRNF